MENEGQDTYSQESIDLFRGSQSEDLEVNAQEREEILPQMNRPAQPSMRLIYEEVCALRREVKDLKREIMKNTPGKIFQVDGSNVKKPLTALLKSFFFTYPWIREDDEELKRQITSVLEGCGWEADRNVIITCFSFASHSFTNWRNQVRQKLVTQEKRVEQMPIKTLQRYLFSAFWVSPSDTEEKINFKVTLALRAFADGHKLFKKNPSTTAIDFWRAFKKNIDAMMKQSPDRWVALEQRMVKKIEAFNKED
ncbi:uncharacterized protein LOC133193175 [Saccostrea echinata]|uniref:uncharacterized protein LOC133193175 n=1 Tax=Saccostrea echinata TaxID=191078 RepID=UPI002A7EC571|nr:uncharacterized protein LOC133193175 [Saccostrea echinata]